jgi:NAD(P)-dependent dehydrogenase (short-subunit alcohol dehydrogenase family)
MKIVVVGGSGLIGSTLVTMLTRDGHEVVAASRRSGVDAVTGEGLAEALRSASVVIDGSNSPSFEDAAVMKFFKAANAQSSHWQGRFGCRLSRDVVGRGHRPPATERLLSREVCPGEADQGLVDPLFDRPGHAVLRVLAKHRRRGYARQRRSRAARTYPPH